VITTAVKIINVEINYLLVVVIQQDTKGKVLSIDYKEVNL
tara:strand:+ start:192 stop:311 length:120 start_codon:yes stop_codon:yes gene_type:complete